MPPHSNAVPGQAEAAEPGQTRAVARGTFDPTLFGVPQPCSSGILTPQHPHVKQVQPTNFNERELRTVL